MSIEGALVSTEIRRDAQEPFCGFFAGGTNTPRASVGIRGALERVYGQGRVATFDSAFSPETVVTGRHYQQAEVLRPHFLAGEPVHVIVHSLGTSEWGKVKDILKEDDPEFFQKYGKNLQLTIISLGGFVENIAESAQLLGNFGRFIHEQTNVPLVARSATLRRAVDTLNAFPPQNIPPDELAAGVRRAMAKESLYKEGMPEIDFLPKHNFYAQISEELQRKVTALDQELRVLMQEGDSEKVRRKLKERAILLRDETENAFKGNHYPEPEPAEQPISTEGLTGALLGQFRLYVDMLNGKPLKDAEELQDAGAEVIIVLPEYDPFGGADRARKFFKDNKEKAEKNVRIMTNTAHASFAINPSSLESMQRK